MVVGVDPGARSTGVVFIETSARQVLHGVVVDRVDDGPLLPVPRDYLLAVLDRLRVVVNPALGPVVAVETVTRPSWHMKGRAAANPEALLACAVVVGAVLAYFEPHVTVLQVPPGRNGSSPLGAYPEQLVSDAERRTAGWRLRVGTGALRHCRSAFDVAMQAPLLLRASAHH